MLFIVIIIIAFGALCYIYSKYPKELLKNKKEVTKLENKSDIRNEKIKEDKNGNKVLGLCNEVDGKNNRIKGFGNKVIGDDNVVDGDSCTLYGNGNRIDGDECRIIGTNNQIIGHWNKVEGSANRITGTSSYIKGNYSCIRGNKSTIVGNHSDIFGDSCFTEKDYDRVYEKLENKSLLSDEEANTASQDALIMFFEKGLFAHHKKLIEEIDELKKSFTNMLKTD